MPWYDKNTYVVYDSDIDRLKLFLESFGLSFVEEKHKNGPRHYSSSKDKLVLEIYPTS